MSNRKPPPPPVRKDTECPVENTLKSSNTSSTPIPSSDSPSLETLPAKRIGAQVTTNIGKLAGQTNKSRLRTMIGSYRQLCSPFFADGSGDGHFPHSLGVHPIHSDRCNNDAFGNVVVFHIGRAILAYYAVEQSEKEYPLISVTPEDFKAIQFLDHVVENHLENFVVEGDEKQGFALVKKTK